MAEIGAGLGSDFPTALDTDDSKEVDYPSPSKTVQRADVPNDLADAVLKLEAKVGIDGSTDPNSLDYKIAANKSDSGKIEMWGGAIGDIPSGYLVCDGAAVSRTTYANLFAAIGVIHGNGDGSTTFNLPDLRDRFVAGAGATYNPADTGGEATHVLSEAEMPSHFHSISIRNASGGNPWPAPGGGTGWLEAYNTNSKGSNTAHENRPPYYAMVYMIKT